jgi:Ca2+-binding RTX toxin-like protein
MAMTTTLKPYNFNFSDLQFILDQINFRPLFAKSAAGGLQAIVNWNGVGAIYDQSGGLIWDGGSQVSADGNATLWTGANPPNAATLAGDALAAFGTSYSSLLDIAGLRLVNGMFNNLNPGQERWGAADQPFLRMEDANFGGYVQEVLLGAPPSGLIAPADWAHPLNTADAASAAVILSGLPPPPPSHTVRSTDSASTFTIPSTTIDIPAIDRTTTTFDGTIQYFDGHHAFADWTYANGTTAIQTDKIIIDAHGIEQIVLPGTLSSVATTTTVASGGELESRYHGQLQAFDPLHPENYVAGVHRNSDGSVNVLDTYNSDYTISFATPDAQTPIMHSVVDYTPRMISNLVASGGVVTLKDADGHRVDWNTGLYNGTSGTPAEQAAYQTVINTWNAAHGVNDVRHIDTATLIEGAAIVTDWGLVGKNGGHDTQNPENGEVYVGAANPGIAATNGIFTLFGQFFDHGLDFIGKASGSKIVIPLAIDDPLYGVIGADGRPTTSITITRATVSGQDANGNPLYVNHDSPYIDQNQTYGAAEDVTNILREWVQDPNDGHWHAGAHLFDGQSLGADKAWTDAFGTISQKTLPTLTELRVAVTGSDRTALTWEDVTQDLRHRDADGHVGYYNADGAEVAYLDKTGAAHWVDPADARPVDLTGLAAKASGQSLLLDMNPRFDAAHISASAIQALNTAFGSNFSTDYVTGTKLTVGSLIANGWINPADFSINKTLYNVPGGTAITAVQHAAVGEVLLESVGDHYIAGDGRANENVGLTAIHHVFHEEHAFQVQNLEQAIVKQDAANSAGHAVAHSWEVAVATNGVAPTTAFVSDVNGHYEANGGVLARDANGNYFAADGNAANTNFALDIDGHKISVAGNYTDKNGFISWDQDKIFSGAKLTVEMEYQHAAVDQYARAVTPNIQEFAGTSSGDNAAVTLEYAQAAFRFGHSQLRETIDTMDPDGGITGKVMSFALQAAFLDPAKFAGIGAGSIVLGMERQQSNEIDEFVTPALQQGLLGQPLDLATINIARGRDLGMPTLNTFREAVGFTKYSDWLNFKDNMVHPDNLVNFIAAYSLDGNVKQAQAILDAHYKGTASFIDNAGQSHTLIKAQADAWLQTDKGVDKIDLWLGGLAEVHVSGGVLGETFDAIFVAQITKLMDDDRFYYLQRLVNQQFGDEIINEQFKDIFERTTGTQHLNGNIFGYADAYYELANKALAADGHTELANSDLNVQQASADQHKYGQIIENYAAAHGGAGLGIWSDKDTGAASGSVVHFKWAEAPLAKSDGPTGAGEPHAPASYAQDYIADNRPNVTGANTNADGTAQSGAESSEVIVGTDDNDFIRLGAADDTAYGEGGDDIIYGGSPTVVGDAGGASAGLDHLYGGAGQDILYGEDMPDLMDGGQGDDWLYGGSSGSSINGIDQLIGSEGNDHIYGGVGIDKLYGGLGDDYIYGGDDTDPFTSGGDGNDYINGDSGQDINYGGNGSDILDGGKGIDLLYGDAGDDILRAGSGDSQIAGNGGGGDDLIGGDGVSDTGFDLADYSQDWTNGGVAIDLTAQFAGKLPADLTPLPPNVNAAITTINVLAQLEGVVGSKNGDHLQGDSTGDASAAVSNGDNWLIGGAGNDVIEGRGGNDVIIGGSVRLDTLIGHYVSAIHTGDAYRAANDFTSTTDGASHRIYDDATLQGGYLEAASGGGIVYDKHLQELLKSRAYKDYVLGNEDANGNPAADGSADIAVFSGDRRDYTVTALDAAGSVIADPAANAALIYALKVRDNGNGERAASDGTDLVIGIEKFQFADGARTLNGLFNQASTGTLGFTATENDNLAQLSISSLNLFDANNVSDANPLGTVTIPNSGRNWQTSSDGLSGWTDVPAGNGSGQQSNNAHVLNQGQTGGKFVRAIGTYTDNDGYANTAASQVWNLIVGTTGNNAVLNGTDSGDFGDAIFGLSGNDTIRGGGGDDYLDGGSNGNAGDLMLGGAGGDIYIVNSSNDRVDERTLNGGGNPNPNTDSGGADTVVSSISFDLSSVTRVFGNVENLTLTGNGNNDGTGNALANVITGNGGANTLNGGSAGADSLIGKAGNDIYIVNHAGMTVIEYANQGTDTVRTSVTFTLGGNLENLTLTGNAAINGTGNGLNNVLTGNAGSNALSGQDGNDLFVATANDGSDTYIGGTGADTYDLSGTNADATVKLVKGTSTSTATGSDRLSGIENVTGGGGNDVMSGDSGVNILSGGQGSDSLFGGAAGDTLLGGTGSDHLYGGTGGDVFTGGAGADDIHVGTLGDAYRDTIRFTATAEYGDQVFDYSSLDAVGLRDVVQFAGQLNTSFDDNNNGASNNTVQWAVGNEAGGALNANLSSVEALYLSGKNAEGVGQADLGNAALVAAAFNAEFNISSSTSNNSAAHDALLVINDTNGNSFAVWQYIETTGNGTEIQANELTLIGTFHSNGTAVQSQFIFA